MRATFPVLFLVVLLASCSQKPPFDTGKPLAQAQLDWYIERASGWLDTHIISFGGGVDRDKPATARVSQDSNTVDVSFRARNGYDRVVVHVELRSGTVTSADGVITESWPNNAVQRTATAP